MNTDDARILIDKLLAKANDRAVTPEERQSYLAKVTDLRKKYHVVEEPTEPENKESSRAHEKWEHKIKDDIFKYADIHRWRHENSNVGSTSSASHYTGPDYDSIIEERFKYDTDD